MMRAGTPPLWPALCLAGLALCALAPLFGVDAFVRAWLVAALAGLALPLGALPVLMTHNLTGGRWGEPARPVLKATAATLPWTLLLFVPLLLLAPRLLVWSGDLSGLPDTVAHKGFYLNLPFFYGRFALYALVWLVLAARLGVWRGERRPTGASAGGLVLWALTVTFFAVDWIMSLEPAWYSDILGLIVIGSLLSMALAVPLLTPGVYHDRDPALESARRDLVHLWLTAILFWVFVAFSQYLIIWSGDLPHEIRWYLHRSQGGWQWLAAAMMVLCGALPFVALLPRTGSGAGAPGDTGRPGVAGPCAGAGVAGAARLLPGAMDAGLAHAAGPGHGDGAAGLAHRRSAAGGPAEAMR
ncbi:hypothetical protein HML84_04105 [Alcanivorax sp. IO_7]|nr:hypothetical protein HML84_04105 [Alcanivorax sp. IO_7]